MTARVKEENTTGAMRRVVTGQTSDGASVLASDAAVDAIETPLLPGGSVLQPVGGGPHAAAP